MVYRPGRHLLQIPGPTNVPDRVLRAIDAPTIDHRGPDFAELGLEVLEGLRTVCRTDGQIVVYPASGTGAWEAALVNTLSPGDKVIACETGHFATLWRAMAARLGLEVVWLEGDWRHGADPERIADALDDDVRAVMVVHNETSTGVTSRIADVRAALGDHDALLLVDTISSLASIDYRHDEWGVDVTVAGSQKGLMLPAGLSFNAVSEKALEAAKAARMPRSYWDWAPIIAANANGYWPYTSATNLLYGLREALQILLREEGLEHVFARHARHAAATRAAVAGWGLEVLALDERELSNSLTAVVCGGSDEVRRVILERFDMSLGAGLGRLADEVFRIGHLGDFNDLMLAGTLSGVQMGLKLAGHDVGDGVGAALELLAA
ncbi:pyridoxal-phosphate-dependent aminotransferase family protein [Solirubrobacter ginsenosidimutans]|uniref:pyridoxal-phosphate-dependent aminotransferase family protein n=1 Tax=Solirubrobacter ginsenosidimutans TaxID=490573 RepID=UPI00355792B6